MVEILNLAFTSREIFLIVFLAALGAFLYWDRKNVERQYILFYRRTQKGIDLIDRIAKKAPRFWNIYGWSGVVTGFLSIIAGSALFIYSIGDMIRTQSATNGPSLLLPGLVESNQFQAGVSFIPVEYWVIGIGILMVVHEMSHGIVTRTEGFELNSVGWIVMGILPGAFVEPKGENMLPGDEANEDPDTGMWEQGNWKQRLKVLGAGSFANYVTGAIFLLAAIGLMSTVSFQSDVQYTASPNFSAYDEGMRNGTLIQINGQNIENAAEVTSISQNLEINDTVNIWSSEGNFTVTATEGPSDGAHIGIRVGQYAIIKDQYSQYEGFLSWFISLLQTVALLNIFIGLFNMLPIKPLDGGLMFETVVSEYAEDKMNVVNAVSLAGWTLILGSMVIAIIAGLL